MKRSWLGGLPLLILLGLVVFFWRGLSLNPQLLPLTQLDRPVPAFQLPNLEQPEKQVTSKTLQGQLHLLVVWASWCAACIDEQSFLLELADSGVPILGLNYKDKAPKAKAWLERWGNPYRYIAEDALGNVAIDLGVYGAPETFLIDAAGIIRYRHVGVLDKAAWQTHFVPYLDKQ